MAANVPLPDRQGGSPFDATVDVNPQVRGHQVIE